jgi:hypothetical protein
MIVAKLKWYLSALIDHFKNIQTMLTKLVKALKKEVKQNGGIRFRL